LFLVSACFLTSMLFMTSAIAAMTNDQIDTVGAEINATPESIAEAKRIKADGGTDAQIAAAFAAADLDHAASIAAAVARVAPPSDAASIAAAVARVARPADAQAIADAVAAAVPQYAAAIRIAVTNAILPPPPNLDVDDPAASPT